jgi:iron complex outermembrane receptor protein
VSGARPARAAATPRRARVDPGCAPAAAILLALSAPAPAWAEDAAGRGAAAAAAAPGTPTATASAPGEAGGGVEEALFEEPPAVVAASRRRQSLEDAPADVSVVTAEQIRRHGWRTVTEVLANVRGLYVSDDRNYSYLGVRGFARPGDYNQRVLVLVNGHAMNDGAYGSSLLGREFGVDVEAIEQVEVIRGTGSALYGTNALLAVVNVVTRQAPDARHAEGAGVTAIGEADSLERGKVGALVQEQLGESARLLASASYFASSGRSFVFRELEAEGFAARTEEEQDRERAGNFYANLALGALALQGQLNWRRKHVPTASYDSVPQEPEYTDDARGFLEARLDVPLDDRVDLAARVYYDAAYYAGRYPESTGPDGAFKDVSYSSWAGSEALLTWRPLDGLRGTAGVVGQQYLHVSHGIRAPAADRGTVVREAFPTLGVFADAELSLGSVVTLSGGARYDWYETFGERVSPRAAVVLAPLESTRVKLIYGEAFRAPNTYELFFAGSGLVANPTLDPEVLREAEAIVEQDLGARGRATASVFYYRIDDLIDLVTVDEALGTTRYENRRGDVEAWGIEASLEGRLPWLGLRGHLGYTFSDVRDERTEERFSNSPQHVGQARLTAPIAVDRFFLAAAARWIGERPGLPGRRGARAAVLFDLTLTVDDAVPGLDVGIGATNLLDERWVIPGAPEHRMDGIPQDGRAVWARVAFSF